MATLVEEVVGEAWTRPDFALLKTFHPVQKDFYPFHFQQCQNEEVEQIDEEVGEEVEEVEDGQRYVPLVGGQGVVGAKEVMAMKHPCLSLQALGA